MHFHHLFYRDPYCQTSQQRLVEKRQHERAWVLRFEDTCFYPLGGGQPGDRGQLVALEANLDRKISVLDCFYLQEQIWHLTDLTAEEAERCVVGQIFSLEVEFRRRFALMQAHSAEHLLSGIVKQEFAYDNVGFGINEMEMVVDFNGPLSRQEVSKLEAQVNALIRQGLPFQERFVEGAEAETLDFRSKKALDGSIRLISVEGVDCCACCGTHCHCTHELGAFKVRDSYKHRGGTRLHLLCGTQLLDYLEKAETTLNEAAALVSKPWEDLVLGIEKLKHQLTQLQGLGQAYSTLLVDHLAGELPSMDGLEKRAWAREFCAFDLDWLRNYVKQLGRQTGALHVAYQAKSEEEVALFMAEMEGEQLEALVQKMRTRFQVKGGGPKGFFQGTVCATVDELSQFFNAEKLEQLKKLYFPV